MFESKEKLGKDIVELLDALRELGGGRYACALEPRHVLFEAPGPGETQGWALRRFLEENSQAVFALPRALEAETGPDHDLFEDWTRDEFLVAVLNGRVAVVVACAAAEALKERSARPLKALADRLLRFNESWRLDSQGRGLFLGRVKLDVVVVGAPPDA